MTHHRKVHHVVYRLALLTRTPVFAHMLELSSKVGSALAASGANDVAGSVLTEAAEVGSRFLKSTGSMVLP